MNQITKYIGLLAILPLVMVAIAPNLIGEVDARGAQDIPFDPVSKDAPGHQGAQTSTIPEHSTRGAQAQEAEPVSLSLIPIELRDDTRQQNKADVAQKTTKGFVPKGDDFGIETFRTIYVIANEGGGDVRNVEIQVTSDFETVQAKLLGNLDSKHSTVTVMIKAVDPASINAEILGFEIRN